jgi:hypothetical protein
MVEAYIEPCQCHIVDPLFCFICNKITDVTEEDFLGRKLVNSVQEIGIKFYYYTYARCRPLGHHRTCKPIAN